MKVDSGSLIYVDRNVYSVHSRLIGEKVEARLGVPRLWKSGMQGGRWKNWRDYEAAASTTRRLPAHHRLAGAEAGCV